jgi:glycosyltransferase involved in cell wall biosynthesis
MKIALVHDYLSEYGGAERVLSVLSEMYPEAPIYTAFAMEGSSAWKAFRDKKIIESSIAKILKFKKLYSPLRFLAPLVWENFDFSGFDIVISSASWYITKGIITKAPTKHVCYCHTPPRYLYGYPTAIEWQRYLPIRIYAAVVNSFLRKYDFIASSRVDKFLVNSKNVAGRVRKFYKRDSEIVYPPVEVAEIIKKTKHTKKEDYYLIVSRVVGAKGIDMAMEAANKLRFSLKIVGETAGLAWEEKKLTQLKGGTIEFLGRRPDEELWELYAKAKGFLALAKDEDFGMTVVEAMAAGTAVIAFYGGGYKETVIDGETGVFFKDYNVEAIEKAVKEFEKKKYKKDDLIRQADKFSKEKFVERIRTIVGE